MTTIIDSVGNGFSKKALKEAVAKEKISDERHVELNELAAQVAEQFAAGSVSPHVLAGIIRLAEFFGIAAIGIAAFLMYVWPDTSLQIWYVGASFLGALLTIAFNQGMDGYIVPSLRSFGSQISKVATALTMAVMLLVLIGFLAKFANEFSRFWVTSWFAVSLGYLVILRLFVAGLVKKYSADGRLERRAVIVGGGEPAADLIHSLEAQAGSDIRICGIFDDRTGDRSPPVVAGYPKLGTIGELVEFGRKARINMLIVSLPLSAEKRVLQLLKRLWVLPVDIRLSAHTNKLRFRPRSYTYEGAVPFLDVFEKPIADWDSVMKRIFDIAFATGALIALSPLMLLTALAVKLESKGPIFFRQKRYGFNNEEIDVLKFRSLYHGMGDAAGIKVVTKGDNRVTRVGRIIRKTSIDELPQLFNVLTGKLSLVGPRPHVVNAQTGDKLWNNVVDSYFARHKVKPGVTGWAQVNGWRGEIDREDKLRERVNHDLYYIENWSLMFDLYILAITPFKILNTENAY